MQIFRHYRVEIYRTFILILLIFASLDLDFSADAAAGWLALAGVAISHKSSCHSLRGLSKRQVRICQRNIQQMQSVQIGAHFAIAECGYQFRHRRWNCSMVTPEHLFGGSSTIAGTREIAFLHAIASAGVAHSIIGDCSAGRFAKCGCDMSQRGFSGQWQWGGCSDNIHYGILFSKKFVDAHERKKKQKVERYLMNLHNNEAGRKVMAIETEMRIQCRCHGVSGSCELRTCWKKMPTFRQVGDKLKERFDGATEVKLMNENSRLYLTPVNPDFKPQTEQDLVYLDKSPNYCEKNDTIGTLGTVGRECNIDSKAIDGCDLLCCDRGYNERIERQTENCHCKFIWCCEVKCKKCEKMVHVYTCA